jgi:predicted TIM-barrel fold metal-dependent hydrolase
MSIPPWRFTRSRQIAVREEWLALAEPEEVLEPGLPILDPHHHLWDHPGERYLFDDLRRDAASGHDIRGSVFVQCGAMYRAERPEAERPLGETEFANGVAAMSASGAYGRARFCAGIIGLVDVTLPPAEVERLIEAHRRIAGPRFVGVRNRTAWHPSPEVRSNLTAPPPGPLGTPAFAEGARALARAGLVLDVWCYHTQLPMVLDLARAVPELIIVLDHLGGPLGVGPFAGRREEVFAAWRPMIRALAACPNMRVKLGGLAMEVGGWDFQEAPRPPHSRQLAEAWRPWIETAIEAFGPGRAMFESNFPVDKGMCGYRQLWNAFKRLAAGAGEAEKAALFAGTAVATYGLAGVDLAPPADHIPSARL